MSETDLSEVSLRVLLESAPDAIVVADQSSRMRVVNARTEQLFGYERADLLGQRVDMLVADRSRRAYTSHREACAGVPNAETAPAAVELVGRRRDGSEFAIEISLSAVRTHEGAFVASAIRDISERKQVERQMQEGSRLKSQFLANMSHELRTPLNAIIGFVNFLHKGNAGSISPEQREYLGDVLSSSRHLLQLINDVLDLAKIESGMMEFRPEPIDVAGLVGEVRDVLRGLAASKHLNVDVTVDPAVAMAYVDPARVRQILYNYLSNAIKFTPDGGAVYIRVVPEGADSFRCDVEDTGVGISKDDLQRLFNDFQQVEGDTSKAAQGTGLGLALTKRLAEAQGGRVEARSTEGRGSTFSVVLPRRMPAPLDAAMPS